MKFDPNDNTGNNLLANFFLSLNQDKAETEPEFIDLTPLQEALNCPTIRIKKEADFYVINSIKKLKNVCSTIEFKVGKNLEFILTEAPLGEELKLVGSSLKCIYKRHAYVRYSFREPYKIKKIHAGPSINECISIPEYHFTPTLGVIIRQKIYPFMASIALPTLAEINSYSYEHKSTATIEYGYWGKVALSKIPFLNTKNIDFIQKKS